MPAVSVDDDRSASRSMVAAGAATMLRDADLSSSTLTAGILDLVDDERTRAAMGAAATAWARPDAAGRIAALAVEVARPR